MRSPCKRQRVSPAAAPEAYPLPAALLDEKSEPEPIYEPWPARALVFKCWPVSICGDRDAMVVDELLSRGWVDGGLPCNPDDVGELPLVLSGKHPTRALPRRALWIPTNAAEVKVLHEAFAVDKRLAARFCVGGIPSSGLACFKTYTARAVGAEPFVPLTFVLPAQRAELLVADAALRKSKAEPILWVGKPKCNYAGRGITVTVRVEDVADGTGVVQRYVHRPLLIGGYKFHMRVYMLVTSLAPPRAYVHSDMAVMFATLPYSLDASTLGKSFQNRVHLTNYDINATPTNASAYLQDKPGVGAGCLWDAKRLEAWLRLHEPTISIEAMWRQIRLIGRGVALSIAAHPGVVKSMRQLPHSQTLGYELFGIDVMFDDLGKVWLLECNDSPGLEYCGSHFADGTPSPDAVEGDATTRSVIHDTFALLGLDRAICDKGDASRYLRVC